MKTSNKKLVLVSLVILIVIYIVSVGMFYIRNNLGTVDLESHELYAKTHTISKEEAKAEINSEVIKNQPKECEKLGQDNNQSSRLLSGQIASASIVDTRKRCEGECWDIESFLHISLETGDKDLKTRIQVTTERSPLPKLKPLLQKIREEKDNKTYEFCAYQRAYDDPFMQQAYGGWYHVKLEELSPRK